MTNDTLRGRFDDYRAEIARDTIARLAAQSGADAQSVWEAICEGLRNVVTSAFDNPHPAVAIITEALAAAEQRGYERERGESQWQDIATAPRDDDILIWYDHGADSYCDPNDPKKLTDYAAWAEGGDFIDGKGWAIAKWHDHYFESEDEYGNGYWMPAAWFIKHDGDYEVVCNPTHWMPLPTPPAIERNEQGDA